MTQHLIEGRNPTPDRQSHRLLKQAWDRIGEKLTSLVQAAGNDIAKAEALSRVETVMEDDWILIQMVTDSKAEASGSFGYSMIGEPDSLRESC